MIVLMAANILRESFEDVCHAQGQVSAAELRRLRPSTVDTLGVLGQNVPASHLFVGSVPLASIATHRMVALLARQKQLNTRSVLLKIVKGSGLIGVLVRRPP